MARPKNDELTTIKVRVKIRRWIKIKAADEGKPMYETLEELLAKAARGRPWEKEARA